MTIRTTPPYLCVAGDSVDGIHDALFAAITAAHEKGLPTRLTASQGEEIAAIVPPAWATTAELLTVPAVAALDDMTAARDRVIAILRHALCYDVLRGNEARLVRDRKDHLAQAYANGRALEAVLRELGDPGDRSLPKPAGELPLDPRAEKLAREYLSSSADRLLGKRRVQ